MTVDPRQLVEDVRARLTEDPRVFLHWLPRGTLAALADALERALDERDEARGLFDDAMTELNAAVEGIEMANTGLQDRDRFRDERDDLQRRINAALRVASDLVTSPPRKVQEIADILRGVK